MSNKAIEKVKRLQKEESDKRLAYRDSHSRIPTKAYKDNWDRIFGSKDKSNEKARD